jgi:branched-chain amino acid transport system ATP-binding protein
MPLLKVRNIESYYGPIMAIKGVSLEVGEDSIVTILGANGAGKTTILKTISGIIDPEKGTIEFMGQPIERMDPEKIVGLGISHVPEGREVFDDLSVKDNLLMGAFLRKDKADLQKDYDKVYEYFPILKQRPNQISGSMSGGEQQMVVIGRALMSNPKLLLLDEPSLGLSPLLVKEIFNIIKMINKEQGTPMLLVEQNALMALATAHWGFVLELGRMVMDDSCEELLQNPDIKEFYLGLRDDGIRGTKRWKRKKRWR